MSLIRGHLQRGLCYDESWEPGEQAATGNNQKKAWITPTVEELDVMAHTQNDIAPGASDAFVGQGFAELS